MTMSQSVSLTNEQAAPALEVTATAARDQELAELARLVAAGDQNALAQIYDRTSRLVYSVVYRVLGEPTAAEEVTLDVFMQVWQQAGNFDAHRGSFVTWLVTIARSRAIDRRRASRLTRERTEQLDLSEPHHAPRSFANVEESALLSERGRLVRAALFVLPPEQREALELGYFLGLSHSEIAERLKQPLGTIKTRVRLGMLKLRESLKPQFERSL